MTVLAQTILFVSSNPPLLFFSHPVGGGVKDIESHRRLADVC